MCTSRTSRNMTRSTAPTVTHRRLQPPTPRSRHPHPQRPAARAMGLQARNLGVARPRRFKRRGRRASHEGGTGQRSRLPPSIRPSATRAISPAVPTSRTSRFGVEIRGRPTGRWGSELPAGVPRCGYVRRSDKTYMPSVPTSCGSRSAPRPRRRHGEPGAGSATSSGSACSAQASTPVVSASVRVQTE